LSRAVAALLPLLLMLPSSAGAGESAGASPGPAQTKSPPHSPNGGRPSAVAHPRPSARSPSPALRAGAGTAELPLPAGVPVAGYGSPARRLFVPDLLGRYPHAFWLRPSTGTRDPIMARAIVLETRSARVLWVAVDLVAVDPKLVGDVRTGAAAAGRTYSDVIVSASHTHSGPGAYVDSEVFGALATDRFDAAVRRAVLDGILTAVERAERDSAPALVGAGTAMAPPVTESRLDRPLDREIAVLKLVRPGGRPVALVWNFAIHGTTLPAGNLRLSADVMGDASRRLEEALGAPALFVNGAVGDVSPRGHGEAAIADLGEQLAATVHAAWAGILVADGAALATVHGRIDLPPPFVSVRNCLGHWLPGGLTIPLDSALPRSAEVVAVALGGSAWVTIPGELETRLGQVVKRAGRRHFPVAFVAGLSNGYLGYLLTPDAYRGTGYIECASLYGERAGDEVASVAARLLERLGTRRGVGVRAPALPTQRFPSRAVRGAGAPHPAGDPKRKSSGSEGAVEAPSGDLAERCQAPRERGLLPGGGVAVDHALGDSLVELANRLSYRIANGGRLVAERRARQLGGGPDRRPDGAVPLAPPLALPRLLDRRLDIRQELAPPGGLDWAGS